MAEIIRMPRMSDTMEEGNIVAWHKKVGDTVEPGDLLAEVETDKATMEMESLWNGVLLHIAIPQGPVPVNNVIAVIGKKGEDWAAALNAPAKTEAVKGEIPVAKKEEAPVAVAKEEQVASEHERLKASPLARKIAKDEGLDLKALQGSGDHGRIVKRDVEALLSNRQPEEVSQPQKSQAVVVATGGNYEDVPLSQMRKTIARRLSESKNTAPHFYLTMEIDMEACVETRKRMNEISTVKISVNDIIIKAVAVALRKHPAANSSWLGDRIRYNKDINIGVAVAVEEGLVVPVIRDTDRKQLSDIAGEVRNFAEKAKSKKLMPEEMQGNTFTISNLGMFGIDEFTAIINPPDACILAVGAVREEAVVKQGAIVIGQRMKVTLSCDHRVVDGVTGAKFLQELKGILEEPIRLVV